MKYSKSSAFVAFLASVFTLNQAFSQEATTKPATAVVKAAKTAAKAAAEVKKPDANTVKASEVVAAKPVAAPAKPVSVVAPNIDAIDAREIEEGGKFEPVILKNFVSDEDNKVSELKWSTSGYKDLKVSIVGGKLKVSTPDKNWNGRETVVLKVSDPSGNTATGSVDYVVNSVNDLPVIKQIKGQKIKEGSSFKTIKLDDFIKDEDHKDSQISWSAEVESIKGFRDEELSVDISSSRIATIKLPNAEWYGQAKINFMAVDLDGAEVNSEATFEVTSVNDKPVLSKIPAQKINEGDEFSEVSLEEFVKDADHELDQLKWEVSGAKELKVNLDQDARTIAIQTPSEDWAGKPEKIKIIVTDPEGGKDESTLVLSVVSVNDEPELSDIEGQDIQEGQQFKAIDLASLVKDKDHKLNQLKWTFRGNKDLKVQLGSDRKATIKIPNENWHGSESITFIVTDPEGAKAETEASFSVESINDKPMVEAKLKGQSIKEGAKFKVIDLDKLVKDEDHSDKDISWSAELETTKANNQDTELSVEVNDKRQAVITIPNENYYGAAKISFVAMDPDGDELKISETFEVQSVNDKPTFTKITDQTIAEGGQFESINLRDFVSDVDHAKEKLKFSSKGNKKLKVKIEDGIATVSTPDEEFSGKPEKITFEVTDPEKGKASIPVTFTVTSINDAPVLKSIQGQTIKEGGKFQDINLEKLVSDKDHKFSNLKWSFPGKANLKVVQKGKKATIKVPHENWYGEETITAKVTDPEGASAETSFTLKVESVNDLPVLKKLKSQKIKEGDKFSAISLDKFVSDEDHKTENLTWTTQIDVKSNAAKGTPTVSVDANRNAIISTPNKNWNGVFDVTYTVTDADGGQAKEKVTYEVKSVNDKPKFLSVPKLTIAEGAQFEDINLDNLVEDLDHNKPELKWTVKGGKNLKLNINSKSHIANVVIPSKEWSGAPETFTLTVTDPEGGKATEKLTLTVKPVNDAPVLSKIKAINIKEGDKLTDIDLKGLVKDVDNKFSELKWTFTGAKEVKASLAGSKLKLKSPGKEWHGSEQITVKVTDPQGATASQVLSLNVKSVNDLPKISKIKDSKIKEGESLSALDLNSLVTDIDHKDEELTWSFDVKHNGPKAKGELKLEVAEGKAKFVIPNKDWYGSAVVSYSVKDPEGGSDKGSFKVEVKSVNDKPVLKSIANQTIQEGESFKGFSLDELIEDVETADSKIKWSIKGGKDIQLNLNTKKRTVSIKTPGKEYAGKPEVFTITAEDADGAKVSTKLTLEVKEVNDAPIITKFKGQSIKEGEKFQTIDLGKLVKDVDHKDNQLTWTVSGQSKLKVSIKGSKAKVEAPNKDWFGKETLTFKVTDAAGASATQVTEFSVKSVNDLPEMKKVKGQKIKEGETFQKINLKKLVADSDHSLDELKWSSKINFKTKSRKKSKDPQPKVIIDDNGLASVTLPSANYHGAFDVTFTVTDPEKGKASQTASFDVKSVNDKPVLKGFVSQKITEGGKFKSVSLSDKVTDADHSTKSLKWSFKGNKKLKVSIDRKNNLIVQTPSKEWSGSEDIILEVKDPDNGKAKIKLNYAVTEVNDLPVIKGLKGQTIKEGSKFAKIKLDDLVSDADHSDKELKWSITGGKELKAKISPTRVLDIQVPNKDWNGPEELFTLTVQDPAGGQAQKEIGFEVKSVNDLPVIKKIKGQKIKEGESFTQIKLDEFITDADHSLDEIKWSVKVSPKSASKKKRRRRSKSKVKTIEASIDDNRVVTFKTPSADWNGQATVTFTAVDGAKAKVSTQADFEVTSVNDLPVLSDFKSQTIKEGGKFKSVNLKKKVTDKDHPTSKIKWSVKGNKKLKATIDRKSNLIVSTPDKNWSGEERLILEAKDPEGGSAKIALIYKVTEVNDLPKIAKIKSQKIKEGSKFKKVKLDNFVKDADHKDNQIKWTVEGAKELKASVNSGRQLIVDVPSKEWSGKETLSLIASDPVGGKDTTKVTYTVTSVNDAPTVKKVANQTVREGQVFAYLDLSKYVSDPDHKAEELIWYFSDSAPKAAKKSKRRRRRSKKKGPSNGDNLGKNKLQVILDGSKATIEVPNEDWNGKEKIFFIARDPEGAESFVSATFTVTPVNDVPKITPIPDQVVNEGKPFKVVKLDNYVEDPDHKDSQLKWFYKTPKVLKAKMNKSKRTLTITAPSKNWSGSESISLKVKDPKGGQAETTISFKVNSVNDKPKIGKLPKMTVKEGSDFPVIDLNKYVKDPDHEDRRLVWSIKGGASLKANVSFDNKLSIIALSPSWSGTEKFTLSVKDPEGATDTYKFKATVKNVNDAPKGNIDTYSVDEGKTLKVSRSKGVLSNDTDEDGPAPGKAVLKSKPRNGKLKFKADGSFIYTPKKGYNGTDRFTYQAVDKQRAKSTPTTVEIKVYFKMKDIRSKK